MECELCKIIEEKYRLICEDEYSFCIVAQNPLKPGHILVLPKRHVSELSDLSEKEAKSLFNISEKIKKSIEEVYKEGAIIHINTGKHMSQGQHIHIHILPSKGSIRQHVSLYEKVPEVKDMHKDEMEKIKETILESLNQHL
ncbi:MAG: HIT family protein [Candidatus Nanoarchaeia archaeon]